MFHNKNKQNQDQVFNMDCDSIPNSEDRIEAMDVEVLTINPNNSENQPVTKPTTEFGFDNEDEDFEQYSEEDESRPCGTIEFKFENISRFENRMVRENSSRNFSHSVKIRCLPWKILLLFNKEDFGIFVQCNGDCDSNSWNCSAKAKIDLINQAKPGSDKTNMIHHVFTSKENDWGYRSFLKLEELLSPQNGYVLNDCIIVRARIEAEAPHGADWDSKKHTGFVGLKNQGATCYLNSLLQTLYFTNKLKKAVFIMPTESDDSQTSVPLALQRVFYELQFTENAVGTKKLTRSFGWATLDSFMQHDAQELCRVLLDNLENKMKGTSVEDVIPNLFCGKMLSYIRCKNVNYESKREENFYDIQLKVKGNKTVYDAFREYVDVETLDNENKYDAGEYGMQAAEKGVIFTKFPPVLYLQLMRFQYDYNTDMNIKINDRFEFPYRLNLDEFLKEKDAQNPAIYFLHAVLVHSGDNHGGHYVVFINPRGDHSWYEFDDDVVARCERKAAIQQNYGASEMNLRSSSNAYMLVYIRESDKNDVLCSVEERDIPDYLLERFREENRVEELKSQEKRNAHLYSMIHLVLEEDFYGYEGPGLFVSKSVTSRTVRVHRETHHGQFLNDVAEALNRSPNSIRVWRINCKSNDNFRLMPLDLAQGTRLQDDPMQSTFFVQFLAIPVEPSADTDRGKIMFFLKYFDLAAFQLRYVGMLYEPGESTFAQLKPKLNELVGLPEQDETSFSLFRHEINMQIAQITNMSMPITRLLANGDVILFAAAQQSPDEAVLEETAHDALQVLGTAQDDHIQANGKATTTTPHHDLDDDLAHNDVFRLRKNLLENRLALEKLEITEPSSAVRQSIQHYIEDFYQFAEILLVDKNRPCDPGILLTVRLTISYWEFANSVAKLLGSDPHYLQFFRSVPGGNSQVMQTASPQVVDESGQRTSSGNVQSTGNDSTGTPSPAGLATSLISSQSLAAKAAGFVSSSSTITTLLANAAIQGLAREPPGAAISSQSQSIHKHLFQTDSNYSANRYGNMSYHQTSLQLNYTGAGTTQALLSGDRLPFQISRFCGASINQSNSLGPYTLPAPRRIYYVHLNISIEEQETMRQVKCIFVGPKLTDCIDLTLSVPQNGTVNDLLNEARFSLPGSLTIHQGLSILGMLRLLEIQNSRVMREVPGEMSLKNLQINSSTPSPGGGTGGVVPLYPVGHAANTMAHIYRIEEVPIDELELRSDQRIVWVAHIEPETFKPFGTPFSIPVKGGELFTEVKERIRKRLDVSEKEFERWKLIYSNGQISYLPMDEELRVDITLFQSRDNAQQPHLFIEHKPAKRARYATSQKPIKIHN